MERAIQIAREEAQGGERRVYTDGPLIHNKQMMDALGKEHIQEVGDYQSTQKLDLEESAEKESVVVVRAHGISPQRREYLKGLGLPFRDGTCPDVGIIAGKVKSHAERGYDVVIFGDPKHPEVMGLLGYANGRGMWCKIRGSENLPSFSGSVAMVSQSTMFTHEFKKLTAQLSDLIQTWWSLIPSAVRPRKDSLTWLNWSEGAEAIVVIGGNTPPTPANWPSLPLPMTARPFMWKRLRI